ncbi:SGNH/GDSL hydrolase family protein [Aurantibacter sp.]|uniref:SGNH/GDSL hydrolase family protein n=1 Tax=Aurantibacter sp. TaxID=2807103 RepID=UPI00326639BC
MILLNKRIGLVYVLLFSFLAIGCSKKVLPSQVNNKIEPINTGAQIKTINYLALGDSYTIGTSVALESNYPTQLASELSNNLNVSVNHKIIATAGWRTDELLNVLETNTLDSSYDLVTLLIGVNNQYQGLAFTKYEKEFTELFERSLKLANNNKDRLVIISIPDWGFTPFGQGFDRDKISKEIDQYNSFAEQIADKNGVSFIDITDITRRGLEEKELVASDDLHPSKVAYKKFVDRLLPIIVSQLKN